MRALLRLPSFYLALPLLFACAATLVTFALPAGYINGIGILAACAVGMIALDVALRARLPKVARFADCDYAGTREGWTALALAWVVVVFCALDLVLFPIPLIVDPASYATFEGGRQHIRHISDMCWILPPIALLCLRSKALRAFFIATGFIFPVLVLDRNRIFATLFSFVLLLVLRRDIRKPLPLKSILLLAIAGATTFSILGMLRSGSLDDLPLPFHSVYLALPPGLKWLLLYASVGPYNFSAMLAKHYTNATFLYNQLVPFAGSVATAGTDIPLDAANINVGTEVFPFLMAWGPVAAAAALFALYAMLAWSMQRMHRRIGVFSILLFLRLSYVAMMSPFGPQAFIWTNFGFIVICLTFPVLASLLPGRSTPSLALTELIAD